MALPEHEQRILDEIERGLRTTDPKFAVTVDISRVRRRRKILVSLGAVAGLVCLLVGAITTQRLLAVGVIISVVGFLAMVGAIALLLNDHPAAARRRASDPSSRR